MTLGTSITPLNLTWWEPYVKSNHIGLSFVPRAFETTLPKNNTWHIFTSIHIPLHMHKKMTKLLVSNIYFRNLSYLQAFDNEFRKKKHSYIQVQRAQNWKPKNFELQTYSYQENWFQRWLWGDLRPLEREDGLVGCYYFSLILWPASTLLHILILIIGSHLGLIWENLGPNIEKA